VRFTFSDKSGETSAVGLDVILSGLNDHPTVQDLTVYTAGTPNNVATAHIVNFLQRNDTIKTLDMTGNDMWGVCDVVETLVEHITTLVDLTFSTHNEDDTEIWNGGIRRLGTLLPRVRHLATLWLDAQTTQIAEKDLIPPYLLPGLRDNTSLTYTSLDALENTDSEKTIKYYCARNKYGPRLAEGSVRRMLSLSHLLLRSKPSPEEGLSVVYEALRKRDDWFKKLSMKSGSGGGKAKRRRLRK